jgi:uncharacterized protein YkwD
MKKTKKKTPWEYLKTPFYIVLFLLFLGWLFNVPQIYDKAKTKSQPPTPVPTIASLLAQINQARATNGVVPLAENATLDDTAQTKVVDMVTFHYFAHQNYDGTQGYDYIMNAMLCTKAGENLADEPDTNVANTVQDWMNSPEHKANILDASYTQTGFGIIQHDDNRYYIAEHFCAPQPPGRCNPNYTPCVANSTYDLDCADIREQVRVIGQDVYGLDADGDGIGCESY